MQLPLPSGLDPEPVLDLVPAEKDVDGLTERSMGRLVRGRPGLVSCTPLGVMRLLEKYEIPTSGQRAVVIGRSTLVGLPLSLLLNRKGVDATVTMAHSRTGDMAAVVREADIVVGAAGQARMITADMIKPGAAVIDVGVSRTEAGIVGDVDFALRNISTGQVVTSGNVENFTGYSATGSTVATLAAERDAQKRLMVMLAEQLVTRLYAADLAQ